MSKSTSSVFEQQKFVSQLFSLTGPQENLPTLLGMLLANDEYEIRQKLSCLKKFTSNDITRISDKFQNTALINLMIA